MDLARGTVRAYLEGLRAISLVSGSTEHTYREPLVTFLVAASKDLGLGTVGVHGELRLASIGQPNGWRDIESNMRFILGRPPVSRAQPILKTVRSLRARHSQSCTVS